MSKLDDTLNVLRQNKQSYNQGIQEAIRIVELTYASSLTDQDKYNETIRLLGEKMKVSTGDYYEGLKFANKEIEKGLK